MKKSKMIIGIFLIVIVVIAFIVIMLNNKKTSIIEAKEDKEQLTTEDGFITTKEHLNTMSQANIQTSVESYYRYGGRVATETYTFNLKPGKYTMFHYAIYTDLYSVTTTATNITENTVISGDNTTVTKINDYAYILDVTEATTISVRVTGGTTNEDRRTIYGVHVYQ